MNNTPLYLCNEQQNWFGTVFRDWARPITDRCFRLNEEQERRRIWCHIDKAHIAFRVLSIEHEITGSKLPWF